MQVTDHLNLMAATCEIYKVKHMSSIKKGDGFLERGTRDCFGDSAKLEHKLVQR